MVYPYHSEVAMDKNQGQPVLDVLQNAYLRGRRAFEDKVVIGDNPYREYDARHWHWMSGWADAGLEKLAGKGVVYDASIP